MATQNVEGLAELNKQLQEFPAKFEKSVLRGGMRVGVQQFEKVARGRINSRSGKLARSLKIRTRSRRGVVTATLSLGDRNAFYGHMVEFGTKPHVIKARRDSSGRLRALRVGGTTRFSVKHPGSTASPIMRPALDEGTPLAIQAFKEYVRSRLMKAKL